MAELIVNAALFAVSQDLVGLGGLLELFFGTLVVGVAVGMVFQGQFTVGGFKFVVAGIAVDAQDLVVIPFVAHRLSKSLARSDSGWPPPGRTSGFTAARA
jgi:hypothetical protein